MHWLRGNTLQSQRPEHVARQQRHRKIKIKINCPTILFPRRLAGRARPSVPYRLVLSVVQLMVDLYAGGGPAQAQDGLERKEMRFAVGLDLAGFRFRPRRFFFFFRFFFVFPN